MLEWFDIASLPEGEHVALYVPRGDKGNGAVECATVYITDDGWDYWTHGGPNAGSDWNPFSGEQPTHWARLNFPGDAGPSLKT